MKPPENPPPLGKSSITEMLLLVLAALLMVAGLLTGVAGLVLGSASMETALTLLAAGAAAFIAGAAFLGIAKLIQLADQAVRKLGQQ